jgi:hypothetical protein
MSIKKYLYSILSCIVIIMAMLFIGSYKFVDGFRDIPRTQPIVNVETTQAKKAMDASASVTQVAKQINGTHIFPVSESGPFPIGYKNPNMNTGIGASAQQPPTHLINPSSNLSANPSANLSANPSANSVYEKDIAALQAQITRLQAQINAITTK